MFFSKAEAENGRMVKIFVGNVQAESCRETEAELRHLFEQFGEVTECDILTGKTFGFVVSWFKYRNFFNLIYKFNSFTSLVRPTL